MNKNTDKISTDVFIITGDWSDFNGKNTLRLFGSSNEMGTVEIVVTNNKPVFFIENSSELNSKQNNFLRKQTKLKNFDHQPVDAVYFNTQKVLIASTELVHQSGIKTYESDIDPLRRFLMEKNLNSQLKVTGMAEKINSFFRFTNPVIEPCNITPDFTIASIDIETGAKTNQLYSIAAHVTGKNNVHKKVFMLGEKQKRSPEY